MFESKFGEIGNVEHVPSGIVVPSENARYILSGSVDYVPSWNFRALIILCTAPPEGRGEFKRNVGNSYVEMLHMYRVGI